MRHDPYRSADYQENDQKSEGKGQHDNAIRHNARNVRLEAVADGATVNMTVSNDGDPISGPNRDKIFDAFFTTRRDTGRHRNGASDRSGRHDQSWRIDSAVAEAGVAFELQCPAA